MMEENLRETLMGGQSFSWREEDGFFTAVLNERVYRIKSIGDAAADPFLYDYLVKGFFKNACSAMKMADDSQSAAITAYKKKIDNLVFVFPRQLKLHFEGNMSICQRPLRANTPQGERIALSSSESIPAGAYFYCTITTFSESLMGSIEEWLDHGIFNGLGQWHNSGKGRFLWEPVETDDVPEDEVELRRFLGKYR